MQNWGAKSCLFLTPLMPSYKYAAKSPALCKPPAWHATQNFLNVKFHGKQSRLLLRLSVNLSCYLKLFRTFFFFFFFLIEFLHTCNVFSKFSYWIIKDLPVTVINYFLSYFTKDFIFESVLIHNYVEVFISFGICCLKNMKVTYFTISVNYRSFLKE